MTEPGANSGIFIHTKFQEDGWPSKGYEVQVNQSHSDWRKTGSLYSFDDVKEVHVKDNEWYTEHIIVQGDKVTVKSMAKLWWNTWSLKTKKGPQMLERSKLTEALLPYRPMIPRALFTSRILWSSHCLKIPSYLTIDR